MKHAPHFSHDHQQPTHARALTHTALPGLHAMHRIMLLGFAGSRHQSNSPRRSVWISAKNLSIEAFYSTATVKLPGSNPYSASNQALPNNFARISKPFRLQKIDIIKLDGFAVSVACCLLVTPFLLGRLLLDRNSMICIVNELLRQHCLLLDFRVLEKGTFETIIAW